MKPSLGIIGLLRVAGAIWLASTTSTRFHKRRFWNHGLVSAQSSSARSSSNGSTCLETCDNAACVQGNFVDCSVTCNNTGVTGRIGTCLGATFDDGSSVSCTGAGACQSATFSNATTAICSGEGSCNSAAVWQSTLTCSNGGCQSGVHLYASVISCLDETSCTGSGSGIGIAYTDCTCCDDKDGTLYCSANMPKCGSDSNILDFCMSTYYLGQTCAAWGNPACVGLNVDAIADSSNNVDVTVCTEGECQNQVFDANAGVFCENRNAQDTCRGVNATSSWIDCNAGACAQAQLVDCTVRCFTTVIAAATDTSTDDVLSTSTYPPSSCHAAKMERSTVQCGLDSDVSSSDSYESTQPGVCANVDFVTSAVYCPYNACTNAWFSRCSCCDGLGCAPQYFDGSSGGSSCTAAPQEFCSTLYVGRTCKEWGNPACTDIDVVASGSDSSSALPLTICTMGDCQQAVYSSSVSAAVAVLCDNKDYFSSTSTTTATCEAIQVSAAGSTVACEAGACRNGQFTDATVECGLTQATASPSCRAIRTTRSTAICGDVACDNAVFVASAVTCAEYACSGATFDACTCCDGDGCIYAGASSCLGDLTTFCAKCTEKGNPRCFNRTSTASPIDANVGIPTAVIPSVPDTVPMVPSPTVIQPPNDPSSSFANATFSTTSNTPVEIPPLSNTGDTLVVAVWPKHGSIAVTDDRTIVYTPNAGFEGMDAFEVQVCKIDDNETCKTLVLSIQVTPDTISSDSSSAFNGLYLLALLAVLPIGCIAVVVFKRARRGNASSKLPLQDQQPKDNGHVDSSLISPALQQLTSTSAPPAADTAVAGSHTKPPTELSSGSRTQQDQRPQPPGRYSHEMTEAQGQDSSTTNDVTHKTQRSAPITGAVTNTTALQAKIQMGHLPDHKDQCQPVAVARTITAAAPSEPDASGHAVMPAAATAASTTTVMATAVVLNDSTVDNDHDNDTQNTHKPEENG